MLALLLACGAIHAAPWIADLSEVAIREEERPSRMELWLPVGERATIGVYGADEIRVDSPPTVDAQILVQVVNQSHDGLFSVPYWLPPPEWGPPGRAGGPYAIQLYAREQGDHTVHVECGADVLTVDLHVTTRVTPLDMTFGYYTAPSLWTHKHWRKYFEHMRDLKCNTFTIYAGESGREIPEGETDTRPRNVAWQLDLGVETRLITREHPVFGISVNPPDFDGAYQYGKHVHQWPELLGYGKDEAGTNADGEWQARGMVTMFNHNGKIPYRSGAAMSGTAILRFGDGIDIWICFMDDLTDTIKREARRQGKALWVYCCQLRGTNAPLNRYLSGWWAFKNRPEGLLSWVYMDHMTYQGSTIPSCVHEDGRWTPCGYYEYCLSAPDGPISSVGAEARRDGAVDYMVLRDLERAILAAELDTDTNPGLVALVEEATDWLQDNVDRADTNFWPDGKKPFGNCEAPNPCHWDTVDGAMPPIRNFNELRRQAIEYTQRIRAEAK